MRKVLLVYSLLDWLSGENGSEKAGCLAESSSSGSTTKYLMMRRLVVLLCVQPRVKQEQRSRKSAKK